MQVRQRMWVRNGDEVDYCVMYLLNYRDITQVTSWSGYMSAIMGHGSLCKATAHKLRNGSDTNWSSTILGGCLPLYACCAAVVPPYRPVSLTDNLDSLPLHTPVMLIVCRT